MSTGGEAEDASAALGMSPQQRAQSQAALLADAEKQAALAEKAAAEERARAAEAKSQADKLQAEESLRWLAFHGGKNDELRRLIKQYGASVEARNQAGWTPLIMAAWHGNASTCCVLADEFGADLEATNEFGWTALMAATLNARHRCVQELLIRGADACATAKTGLSPKDYAGQMKSKDTLAILSATETDAGMAELRTRLLPPYTLWYIVSCPIVLQEEALEIMRSGRCGRAFAVNMDGVEGVRIADEQWKVCVRVERLSILGLHA